MISIVTINKNNLEGLRRTVNSVLNQTDKGFRWLILDGNSTDGSIDYIKSIKCELLHTIIEDDKGIYQAMNKAIDYVDSNDLIWFLNSGDSIYDEFVVGEINSMNFNGDIVYGDLVMTDYKSDTHKSIEIIAPEQLNILWLIKKTLNHQSYLVRGRHLKEHYFKLEFKVCADWVQLFTIIWETKEIEIKNIGMFLVRYELGGYSNKHETKRLIERNQFLEVIFTKKVLSDMNIIAALVGKKDFPALLRISKSKYRWVVLKFFMRLLR